MTDRIVIDPVTRLEGHARITLRLDGRGEVSDALFHVTQFRGFEKICEGRPFYEMPAIMSRICGICPVSHLVASAKACDSIMAVRIPETAANLRRLLNLAQIVQSHALSFFYLSSPDILLGMDADPAKRNLFGLLDAAPQLARDGIRLRQFGQQAIELLAGKRIHPAWVVAGGVAEPLTEERRQKILSGIPECVAIAERTLVWFRGILERHRDEIRNLGLFDSLFLGLIGEHAELEFYDGQLRFVDSKGLVAECEAGRYADYIGEAVEPWSYLKMPYFKPLGYPAGLYRVGPLARLWVVRACGTERADREFERFMKLSAEERLSSFHYHYARLIEILFCLEKIEQILKDRDILDGKVRAQAGVNRLEGLGVAEAPRGTLIHHYRVDERGLVRWANLIIATGHNNLAMNRAVLQAAKRYVKADRLTEGMLNRVEAAIRAYDPCLSCSTHAAGAMPLLVQLVGPEGRVLHELRRD